MGTDRAATTRRDALPLVLRALGAALLAATGGIHLDLYLTGYRSIPTIGWMFLLQVIAAFALAAVVLFSRDWLTAAVGGGFALATLGAYLLSLWAGLFGFKEIRTTAGIVAAVIDVAAFSVLLAAALTTLQRQQGLWARPPARWGESVLARRGPIVVSAGLISVTALVLLGVGSVRAGGQAQTAEPGQATLKTARVGGVAVLTNSRGFTLYWFAPDTPTTSQCNGSCASIWPPVQGPVSAGAAITGTIGTIKRADGSNQATYDGHPLYTYVADTAPGQARGNNLNLNGGLWHVVPVSG